MDYQMVPQFPLDNNVPLDTPEHMLLSWMDSRTQHNKMYSLLGQCGHCSYQLRNQVDMRFLLDSNDPLGMVLRTLSHLAG